MTTSIQNSVLVFAFSCLLAAGIALTPVQSAHAQEADDTATPDISAMLAQIEQLMELIQDLQEQLSQARTDLQDTIKAGLSEGMTDEDIREIQELLATDPEIYPEGITSGYFGPLTREALKRFQTKHELRITGQIDEDTRLLLEEYLGEKFGSSIPPGLMRAPGIRAKVERRAAHGSCDGLRGMGVLCKKLKDKYDDDTEDDHEHDEEEEEHEEGELEVEVETHDGRTHVHTEYPDGEEESFFLEELNISETAEILDAIAEETGLDRDDIEDVIVFDYNGEIISILNNARAQAEVSYDDNDSSYDAVCSAGTSDEPTGILDMLSSVDDLLDTSPANCDDTEAAYAVEKELHSGEFYCVDSTGFANVINDSKGGGALTCS